MSKKNRRYVVLSKLNMIYSVLLWALLHPLHNTYLCQLIKNIDTCFLHINNDNNCIKTNIISVLNKKKCVLWKSFPYYYWVYKLFLLSWVIFLVYIYRVKNMCFKSSVFLNDCNSFYWTSHCTNCPTCNILYALL